MEVETAKDERTAVEKPAKETEASRNERLTALVKECFELIGPFDYLIEIGVLDMSVFRKLVEDLFLDPDLVGAQEKRAVLTTSLQKNEELVTDLMIKAEEQEARIQRLRCVVNDKEHVINSLAALLLSHYRDELSVKETQVENLRAKISDMELKQKAANKIPSAGNDAGIHK